MISAAMILDLLHERVTFVTLQDPLRVQPFLSKVFEAVAPASGTDSRGPTTFS